MIGDMGFAWKRHISQLLNSTLQKKNIITSWIDSWVHNVGFTEITHQRKRMIERLIATHLLITKEGGLGRHVSMKAWVTELNVHVAEAVTHCPFPGF
jgi:hypothetical protein